MTLANKITLVRVFCIPFFILFLFLGGDLGKGAALLVFIFASLSDLLDGYLARKRDEVTSTGKIIDPIADKILVYSAFICFIQLHLIPFWMVIIILGRDFLVTGLRIELAARGLILPASRWAKLKTVFEDVTILFVFFILLGRDFGIRIWAPRIIFILMGTAVILALISGIHYWVKNRGYL